MKITGERVASPEGGFNPTWQRHVAAYKLAERFLPDGKVLDLGCGVGQGHMNEVMQHPMMQKLYANSMKWLAREN